MATLLGVGEATVKRWADAGEIECFRTPGGHRKFRLRDITSFVSKRRYETSGPLPGAVPPGADELGPGAIEHFEVAAMKGEAPAMVAQFAALRLRGHSLAELFDEVATPALHRVGEKWARGRVSIAEEHIAAQSVVDAIARSQPLAEPAGEPVRSERGVAIVAAVAGEQHDVAARMSACLLRAQGFEVLAPLAQTPARDMADLILRSRAALIALSSTMGMGQETEQVAMAAAAAQQTSGRVIVGGAGMRRVPLPESVKMLNSMRELDAEALTAGRRRARA